MSYQASKQDDLMKRVCRDFMKLKCERENCRFIHDTKLCARFWKNGSCKFKDNCRKNHFVKNEQSYNQCAKSGVQQQRVRNTETWSPMTRPVDMRIVVDQGGPTQHMTTKLMSRDVVYVPNVFSDFKSGELYTKLVNEIENSPIPADQLLKLWHGSEERGIPGCHYICDDKTKWKESCPTFEFVIERLVKFFKVKVEATRLNWYKDTSQWKRFHHDSAYVKEDKADKQNFTIAVSFGVTRDAAFEHATTKTVVSLPQSDGVVYCFSNDTNGIWRHGILQDLPVRHEGRISIIIWGHLDGIQTM